MLLRTQISLSEEDRRLLDAEAKRTGRSISALIRDAVNEKYGEDRDLEKDLAAIDVAFGAWKDRDFDGESYVEAFRTGRRLSEAAER